MVLEGRDYVEAQFLKQLHRSDVRQIHFVVYLLGYITHHDLVEVQVLGLYRLLCCCWIRWTE